MTEDFVVRQCNQRSMKKALIWLLPGGFGPIRRLFFLTFFHRCCSVCLDLTKAASLLGQCHFNTGWREDIKADKKKKRERKRCRVKQSQHVSAGLTQRTRLILMKSRNSINFPSVLVSVGVPGRVHLYEDSFMAVGIARRRSCSPPPLTSTTEVQSLVSSLTKSMPCITSSSFL